MLALLLLLQAFPITPLPAQAEPAVERYAACVFGALETDEAATKPRAESERQVKKALDRCAETRVTSIRDAEQALRDVPGFSDSERRRAFVHERFNGLDAMTRELAAGGLDPDKW